MYDAHSITSLPLVLREGREVRKEVSFWDGIPYSILYMVLRES